jgi:hypothetical protein
LPLVRLINGVEIKLLLILKATRPANQSPFPSLLPVILPLLPLLPLEPQVIM